MPPHGREDETAAIALEHKGAEVFWMGQGREGWVRWEGGYKGREGVGGDDVVHSSIGLSDTTEVCTVCRSV